MRETSGPAASSSSQRCATRCSTHSHAASSTAAGSDEVGVWALDGLPPTGIRSVDGYAQEFTTWPVLEGANASPDARAAEACLG